MTRVLKACTALVVLLFLLSFAYRLVPRQTSLRVEVSIENPHGHRAMLVNDGYLPVVVGVCDTMSTAMQPDTRVGDAIQRWDPVGGTWLTVYHRSDCKPTGVIEARFSHRLLWPQQRLHTYPFFFRWDTGDMAIRAGDKVRFIVFTQNTGSDSPSIPSQPFVTE